MKVDGTTPGIRPVLSYKYPARPLGWATKHESETIDSKESTSTFMKN